MLLDTFGPLTQENRSEWDTPKASVRFVLCWSATHDTMSVESVQQRIIVRLKLDLNQSVLSAPKPLYKALVRIVLITANYEK
jgi:hypothetical protein